MTLPLPWTFSKDDPAGPDLENRLQDVFDVIAQNALDAGGRSLKLRAGTGTIAWPGGAVLSTVLVSNHGLGATPVAVVACCGGTAGLTLYPSLATFTFTATQFSVQASTVDGQLPLNTATAAVYWIAIG
jgi:hypothetical protein